MNGHGKLPDLLGSQDMPELLNALKHGATRRDLLALLAGGGMQMALAAGVATAAISAHAQTPRRGGRIRVAGATAAISDTLDPAKMANQTDYSRGTMLYNGLTMLDERLTPRPALAESFTAKDAKTWIFKLRKDVTFHDGKVLQPSDVIFSLMRQMFRFAVDRDLIDSDPTASIRKAKIGGKDVERDRVLSEDEIRALAKQVPAAGLLVTSQAAIWIALSTCCRIGELLAARWEHVDLAKRTWTIPAENSKNKKAHVIVLSDFAMQQFLRLREITGDSSWCYPNTDNSGPVCPKTVTKQIGDRQRAPGQKVMSNRSAMAHALLLPGGKWTPHDLRRTGATLMTMMGVLPEVAERCLNHTEENKVKRIYQRHSYVREMSDAWSQLGHYLNDLITNEPSASKP